MSDAGSQGEAGEVLDKSSVHGELFRTVELSDPAYECDGLRLATVKSPALGRRADVSLWVPQAPAQGLSRVPQIGTLLILLHGVYGSHWVWAQKGGAHRTAQRLLTGGEIEPLVIAMPNDGLHRDGSGYLTWPSQNAGSHEDVERWIVEEIPAIAHLAAPTLRADAKIAIAGLSMGGYGALRLGAKYATRFAAISAHSSITDVDDLVPFVEEPITDYLACGSRDELSALFWLRKHSKSLPPLRFDCGVDDSLLESNRRLHQALNSASIEHTYEEFSGGHEWPYWHEHVTETLRFVDRHCR